MAQEAAFAGVDALIVRAALAAVPGTADGVHGVEPLEGGIVNRTWRVDTARGRFAVRICLPVAAAAALGVDRGREELLQDLAAEAGIAPRIVGRDPGHRYLVSEFAPGERWTPGRMRDPQRLRQLGAVLSRLHRLPCPELPVQTVLDAVRRQARPLIEARAQTQTPSPSTPQAHAHAHAQARPHAGAERGTGIASDAALADRLRRAEQDFRLAGSERRRPCVVHGDAHHANVIGGPAPLLVDWEYAHVGDPLEDLASIIASDPQAAQSCSPDELLHAFGLRGMADAAMLDAMLRVFRCLNELWEQRATGLAGRHD